MTVLPLASTTASKVSLHESEQLFRAAWCSTKKALITFATAVYISVWVTSLQMSRGIQCDSDHDSVASAVESKLFTNLKDPTGASKQNNVSDMWDFTGIKFLRRAVFCLAEAKKKATASQRGAQFAGNRTCAADQTGASMTPKWPLNEKTHQNIWPALISLHQYKVSKWKQLYQTAQRCCGWRSLPINTLGRGFLCLVTCKSGTSGLADQRALFNEWRWVQAYSLHEWIDPIKEMTLVLYLQIRALIVESGLFQVLSLAFICASYISEDDTVLFAHALQCKRPLLLSYCVQVIAFHS